MGIAHVAAQGRYRWMPLVLAGMLAAGLGGCAQLRQLKARVTGHETPARVVVTRPAPSVAHAPLEPDTPTASLAEIINKQLQLGHYKEGEYQLRRYLRAHPGDPAAQAVLRQLTVDPEQALGHASRRYVVRPGDSYSTLAARYLGDGARFLILARYNGSTDPSMLRVGQTLRLPASGLASTPPEGPAPDRHETSPGRSAADAPDATKARRLQAESVALLQKGQRSEALQRMDQALDVDPRLPPANADARALRKQLVSVYHQRAIVLYRDQQLDQAISLWNRVLAIQPDFEPATVYRARALELKQRLKQY
ncbi:LysM peptidoglycan-binding domain-containing protein [Frateuria hangzhouensis]|uniref:LysM peptidoglycan-binding domain-containing protein n=1 Tax=Frateuria hangzhouensis TaxID=2995589 RepID=UPI002260FB32|nr:LysM peptidoglycan-binding domain-containing protein [Frateuria sp. STR12]MCX7514071.1 LysM peptidoglycan-binding domain-containing protein [Frateuria sp. STR12]